MTRALLTFGLLVAVGTAHAEDWPQFRGPGGSAISSATGVPVTWGSTSNLRWKAELPGRGVSSPVVAGGNVYVTACSGATEDQLHVLCFDLATGARRWSRRFWATGNTICHPKTCMAAPTPVATPDGVYALFASGDLFCLDRDGLLRWCRTLTRDYPEITNHIGMAASPVLVDDVVVVPQENVGQSLVLGVDRRTGRNRWKIERPRDNSWATPLVWARGSRREIVLQSGGKLSAHDPLDGTEFWVYADPDLSKISSPALVGGLIVASTRTELVAIRPGESRVETPKLVWQSKKPRAPTATPLIYKGRIYTVNSAGVLSCAEPEKGEIVWQERVKGPFSASPVLAGANLYLVNEAGVTTVVELGEKPRVLGQNDLQVTLLATPAIAGNALLLRGERHLFCVATPSRK